MIPTPEEAYEITKKYNTGEFHLSHARVVGDVMAWFAKDLGLEAEADYWKAVGILHDVDFELYPEEHCQKAPELLRENGVDESVIHAVVSHGYGICSDVEPERLMEKVLFAADELTGLIGAAALMRPSKSVGDLEVSSVKKKFKDKKFAAGCDRDVIRRGADMLGWTLEELMEKTILAMRESPNVA